MKDLLCKSYFALALVLPNLTYAADALNSQWQFDVAPYLWALNMDGRVQNGPLKTHVDEDFSTIMKQFDGGGMLWLGAHKGPFGIFFNGLYAVLDDHAHVRRFDPNIKTHFGILGAGLSYIVLQQQHGLSRLQLEPYLGTRYTFNDVRLSIGPFTVKNNQHWNDPILGLRMRYDWNPRWLGELSADLGGTNTTTHYSYNLAALLGYKPASCSLQNMTFYLGYRYLYQHYEKGQGLNLFDWNMRLFGPVLGVNFSF